MHQHKGAVGALVAAHPDRAAQDSDNGHVSRLLCRTPLHRM